MRATSRQRLITAARVAVAAGAVVALVLAIGTKELARATAIVGRVGWPLALVPIPTLVAMALDAGALHRILRTLGVGTRWRRLLELRVAVESIVLALPGGSVAGEALKVTLLRRGMGVPIATAAASLALIKVLLTAGAAVYLTCGAVAAAVSATFRPGAVSAWPAALAAGGAVVTGALALVLRSALRHTTLVTTIERRLSAPGLVRVRRWMERRRGQLETVDVDTRRFFDAGRGVELACFAPLALEWFVEGLESFLILRCLSVHLTLGDAWVVDGVGSLLRIVVFFVPAGLGVQDGAQVLLLGMLGIGDAPTIGAAFIFIKRTKELLWIVTGGIFLAVRKDLWRRTEARPEATKLTKA